MMTLSPFVGACNNCKNNVFETWFRLMEQFVVLQWLACFFSSTSISNSKVKSFLQHRCRLTAMQWAHSLNSVQPSDDCSQKMNVRREGRGGGINHAKPTSWLQAESDGAQCRLTRKPCRPVSETQGVRDTQRKRRAKSAECQYFS